MGSTFAAVKTGLDSAPPILFGGIRPLLGGAVMVVLALARSGLPDLRDTWPAYVVLALLNVVLFFGLQTLAILELPSGLAAVLIHLQPVLVGVLAFPLLGEPMTGSKPAGLLLGSGGIVAVSAGAFRGSARCPGSGTPCSLRWSARWARSRSRGTPRWSTSGGRMAISLVVGGVVLTVGGAAVEGAAVSWSGEFVAAFAYASLVGTAVSWSLWFGLVGSVEAGRAASYIVLVPLVPLVIGAVFLRETLGPSLLAGAALVIVGVHLVNRGGPDRVSAPAD